MQTTTAPAAPAVTPAMVDAALQLVSMHLSDGDADAAILAASRVPLLIQRAAMADPTFDTASRRDTLDQLVDRIAGRPRQAALR